MASKIKTPSGFKGNLADLLREVNRQTLNRISAAETKRSNECQEMHRDEFGVVSHKKKARIQV